MEALTAVQVGAGWFSENPGGLDRYYHDLLDVLPEVGVQCRGLVVGTNAVEQETDGAVRTFALPDEPLLRRWRNARAAVDRVWNSLPGSSKKVLVTHFALYGYPLIKHHDGRPWVVHFHGPWAEESRREGGRRLVTWIKRRLEKSVYREADRIVVLSEAFRDLLCKTYGVPQERVDVIPGGVDLDRFADAAKTDRADARRSFGWPTNRPTVLSVRRLTNRMGLENLIDAIALVRERVPEVLCLIAGRGPLVETLAQKIDALRLDQAVQLLGFVSDEDLPLAYRAADVSIMPSESLEGFGLSAAESLAAGTPVLVTPVGGLPEVVRGLDERLVLPDSSTKAIADGLIAALTNPAALPGPEACLAYAAKTFDWQVIGRRIADVYAKAANGRV
ncbi:MAG: glycosyltransferase family 4 protein [Tepidisphaeraceae bacterium]